MDGQEDLFYNDDTSPQEHTHPIVICQMRSRQPEEYL